MYRVVITSRAERDLRRLDKSIKTRIIAAIQALAQDPRPHGCLKVKGEELWRILIGDWELVTASTTDSACRRNQNKPS